MTRYTARHSAIRVLRPVRRRVALGAVALLAAGGLTAATEQTSVAASRQATVNAAASYATSRGYTIGVSVLDTKTGQIYAAGNHSGTYASESVVKVMIAARILVQGRMHGTTSARAYKMITQSDDAIASSFYGSVGGDGLINWVKKEWNVPSLGTPPKRAGWWGNTHITPDGMVRLYAKLKADPRVGPWLLNAMHGHHTYGSDGFYQSFGIPSAASNVAVKQGWGLDYDDWNRSADENTTGYVGGDRYAVAILARGPSSTYGSKIGSLLTGVAKTLLPGGAFPPGDPLATWVSTPAGSTHGGQLIAVHGADLTGVKLVIFGGYSWRTTSFKMVAPDTLWVRTPARPAGVVPILVVTDHGTSSAAGAKFQFVAPPTISSMSRNAGVAGGNISIYGLDLSTTSQVMFGDTPAAAVQRLNDHALYVTVPAHADGAVDVLVTTAYGTSTPGAVDRFTFGTAAPAKAGPSSPSASTTAPSSQAPTSPTAPATTGTPAGPASSPSSSGSPSESSSAPSGEPSSSGASPSVRPSGTP